MTQLTLMPELDDVPTRTGIVYLMTDGYLLKWGYTGRGIRQRSGELRAQVVGFMAGTRDDEAAFHETVRRWCVGGEWFSLPDDPAMLYWLQLTVRGLGGWRGVPAEEVLARIITANLRRAA
jgi:hypothetical protein